MVLPDNGADLGQPDGGLPAAPEADVPGAGEDGAGGSLANSVEDGDSPKKHDAAPVLVGGEQEAPHVVSGTKSSKNKPEQGASGRVKNAKVPGGGADSGSDGAARAQQNKSKTLGTRSLSFPSKGKPADAGLRKSANDGKVLKVDTKAATNGTKVAAPGSAKKSTTPKTPAANQQPPAVKPGAPDEIPTNSSSDAPAPEGITHPAETQRRHSGSGFSFRLEERAEKRKEFLMKLEQKFQAKEEEKTNLQAKSKENQEAEIKQLRKTLTFKATPMPSFYKEPGPPKVELKKIPTTRAVSPKLGRQSHKPSANGVETSPGDKAVEPNKANGAAAAAASVMAPASAKKVVRRPVSKLPQKPEIAKTAAKTGPEHAKPLATPDKELVKANGMPADDQNVQAEEHPPSVTEQQSESDARKTVEAYISVPNIANSEVAAGQVSVMG